VTDTPRTSLRERTILSPTGLGLVASLAALAAVILFATMRALVLVRGRGLSVVDAAAGAALLAVAVALAAGQTDAATLARDRGTGVVLLLVPGLVIVAGAIVATRVAGPVFRLAERVAPKTRPSLRLALLSAARDPGTQLVTVAFLVVSVGLAVFAATYRSTLLEGEQAQAAFAVPLDYTVRKAATGAVTGERPVGTEYARWNAVPVIRRAAQARSVNLTETIDVVGLPSDALRRLRWRSDFAASAQAELARQIAPPRALQPVGPRLPRDAEALTVPVAFRGDPFSVTASVRTDHGAYVALDLGVARRGHTLLRARLPRAARGGTIVGLTLGIPPAESFSAAHAAAEGSAPDVFSAGRLRFGQLRVSTPHGSRHLPVDYRRWVLATESSPAASRSRQTLTIRYLLTQERAFRLRPRQPTDGSPIRVIACASLAQRVGSARVIPLSIGAAVVNAEIVAPAALFPSLECPFVVADARALETAITAAAPGAAVPDEAWIAGPPGLSRELERAARGSPVVVTSRRVFEAELRDNPLASGTVAVLAAGSLLALVLAVVSVLLVVSVELRDESGSFFDLESQGMAPATLRRQLVLRIGSLAVFGVLCGLAVGALLTAVVTDLVAVGAGGGAPMPPLRLHVAWSDIALGLAGLALALAATLTVTTRSAFAGPVPSAKRANR
jgi:hypothetical protein